MREAHRAVALAVTFGTGLAVLGASPAISRPALSVATLEIVNETGDRLPQLEEFSERVLQDALRGIPNLAVVSSSVAYQYIAANQVPIGRLPGDPQAAAVFAESIGANYLLTGSARRYSDDGTTESLEVDVYIVDVDNREYAFQRAFTASGARGERMGHRDLLARALDEAQPELRAAFEEIGIRRERSRLRAEQLAQEEEARRAAAERAERMAEEAAARADRQARAQAELDREAAREKEAEERERAVASLEQLARVEKANAINRELTQARQYLSVEQYNEAFDAVRRALELDPGVQEARALQGQIARDVPRDKIQSIALAQLVFKPQTVDPPPVHLPDHLAGKYVQMAGIVEQYFNGTHIVRQGDNAFAFVGTGGWTVSINDIVLVIGKPDGEFSGSTVLGVAQSIPRIRAVFVSNAR